METIHVVLIQESDRAMLVSCEGVEFVEEYPNGFGGKTIVLRAPTGYVANAIRSYADGLLCNS